MFGKFLAASICTHGVFQRIFPRFRVPNCFGVDLRVVREIDNRGKRGGHSDSPDRRRVFLDGCDKACGPDDGGIYQVPLRADDILVKG